MTRRRSWHPGTPIVFTEESTEPVTPPEHRNSWKPRQLWATWLVLACLALVSWSPGPARAAEKDSTPAESAQEDTSQDSSETEDRPEEEPESASQDDEETNEEKTSAEAARQSASTKEETNNSTKDKVDDDTQAEVEEPPTEKESEGPKEKEDDAADEDAEVEVEVEDDSVEVEPEDDKAEEEIPPIAVEPDKGEPHVQKRVIGATATLMEKKSELLFRARVDTGAKSCSLHIEELKIENESELMADNIGKVARFQIMNGDGESHWLEAKIAGYVIIKTSDNRERRYKVPLTFRYKDFEKQVLVTLNNRENMEFPLLLGRNFLMNDFCVDVSIDNAD